MNKTRISVGILFLLCYLSSIQAAAWLTQLKDTAILWPTEGQCLVFNDGKWRNHACGDSLSSGQVPTEFIPVSEFSYVPFVSGVDAVVNISYDLAEYEIRGDYVQWAIAGRLFYTNLVGFYGSVSSTFKIDIQGLPSLTSAVGTSVGFGSLYEPAVNETSNIVPSTVHVLALDVQTIQLQFVQAVNSFLQGTTQEYIFSVGGIYRREELD